MLQSNSQIFKYSCATMRYSNIVGPLEDAVNGLVGDHSWSRHPAELFLCNETITILVKQPKTKANMWGLVFDCYMTESASHLNAINVIFCQWRSLAGFVCLLAKLKTKPRFYKTTWTPAATFGLLYVGWSHSCKSWNGWRFRSQFVFKFLEFLK